MSIYFETYLFKQLAIAVSGSEKWDPQYATGYLSRKVNQTMDHAVLLVG